MKRPLSLLARIGLTLAATLLLFSAITTAAVAYYVLVPVGQRAADDFAALILLSAQTWVELPPATRPAFEREALRAHGLRISSEPIEAEPVSAAVPYIAFLTESLAGRLGQRVEVRHRHGDRLWYLVDIPVGGRVLQLGFTGDRIGSEVPSAVLLAVVAGVVISLLASLLLARRLTRPLQQLSDGAAVVGQGGRYRPLRESGPRELAALVRSFNEMARQVEELLSNRTTLLAGISHDLRSPIARMTLAAEMLPREVEPDLVDGIRRDLDEMDQLIGQVLELAHGLEPVVGTRLDLRELIDGVVADYRRDGVRIGWSPAACCPCVAPVSALRRVLVNLLDNARRYAGSQGLEITCDCVGEQARISVLDRGPGIPPDQRRAVFRPFYRLESSRSRDTGGSGLGLAVVEQICAAQGWTIELREREGGGAEFRIELPLHPAQPSQTQPC